VKHAGNFRLVNWLLFQVVALSSISAHGGTITGVDGISGPGLGEAQGLPLFSDRPNNDNSANAAGKNGVGFDELIFERGIEWVSCGHRRPRTRLLHPAQYWSARSRRLAAQARHLT